MAPVVGWLLLVEIYLGWLATFAVIWAGFVWVMRRGSSAMQVPVSKSGLAPNPFAAPAPKLVAPKPPVTPPAPVAPKPAPAPVPPPLPTSVQPPVAAPAAAAPKAIEVHPNHSMLPMIAELDLPAPKPAPVVVMQAPKAAAPVPQPPAPIQIVPESSKPVVAMPNLEESGLPALHVMPKRPEDIESSKRGPVVKMNDE